MNRPWWLWPHLLSLDAVAVGLVWQMAFARAFEVPLTGAIVTVLALVLGGIYVGDRRLDVRAGRPIPPTDRHEFHARYRMTTAMVAIGLLIIAAILAVITLPTQVIVTGIGIGIATGMYAIAVHQSRQMRLRVPKEWLVGIVFGLGVSLPILVLRDHVTIAAWPAVLAFMLLIGANCRLIGLWESEPGIHIAEPLMMVTIATVLSVSLTPTPFALSMMSASALLMGLHLVRHRLTARVIRVWADVVLLTPIVWMGIY